jgi:hypothetical protein
MAFGQRQIVHVRVKIMIALGTAVLGVFENDVAWSAGQGVSQIVQSAANRSKPVCTVLAYGTWPPFVVAAAPYKFWSRQILNTCNSLCIICYIFSWSKHLDNLQHRFKFLCWNIGTWTQDTSIKLCIAATVSLIPVFLNGGQCPPYRYFSSFEFIPVRQAQGRLCPFVVNKSRVNQC